MANAAASPNGTYLEHLAKGELAYQFSPEANAAVFYPRVICPFTGSDDLQWRISKGMGTVHARVARAGAIFRAIASVVKVRHLVVAGVSNWGAYGVVTELARLAGRPLLHTAEEEEAMVRACVDAGAVDGLTRRAEPTVDGLPLPAHIGMLELLRTLESPRSTGGPKK